MNNHWEATKAQKPFSHDAIIDINPWTRRRNLDGEARNSGHEFFQKVLMTKCPMTVGEAIELGAKIGLTEREVQLHLAWLYTWDQYPTRPKVIYEAELA